MAEKCNNLVKVIEEALLIIYEVNQVYDIEMEIDGYKITGADVQERLISALKDISKTSRFEWVPVSDGEYDAQHMQDSYIVENDWLTVQEKQVGKYSTIVATIALPDGIRLCRRTSIPEAQA